ncbi:gene transfer agent family protein [Xanthobacter sp. DSM 24535]|uniref:gene transfer agent family protein n=1 Tax=Roseixanthobacter psychrophilus TaxID=3119917 RepID=UPI003726AD04
MGTHDAALTRDWGDGTHTFRLPIDQLLELQHLCDAGPAEIYERLLHRKWRVQDLREIVRLGLIGGGMDPLEALARIKRYVESRPLMESVPLALEILGMALIGPEEKAKTPGKPAAGEDQSGSPPPPSTEPAARSASRRKKSAA